MVTYFIASIYTHDKQKLSFVRLKVTNFWPLDLELLGRRGRKGDTGGSLMSTPAGRRMTDRHSKDVSMPDHLVEILLTHAKPAHFSMIITYGEIWCPLTKRHLMIHKEK